MDWSQHGKSGLPGWVRYWLQRRENKRRWRELTETARQNRLQREAYNDAFWKEWIPLNIAGRDAYYRGAYAEASQFFEGLLGVLQKFEKLGFYQLDSLPRDVGESSRWWQHEIVHKGACDWNTWRRANSDVTPDLRSQCLNNNLDLNGANFAGADLATANLCDSHLKGADFRGANVAGASLAYCYLQKADFRAANLTGAYNIWAKPIRLVPISGARI